jgi:hypothetical protein
LPRSRQSFQGLRETRRKRSLPPRPRGPPSLHFGRYATPRQPGRLHRSPASPRRNVDLRDTDAARRAQTRASDGLAPCIRPRKFAPIPLWSDDAAVSSSAPRLNATKLFMDEKARQAILLLNAARLRATHERTLFGLALVVRRAQVNHLVKPLARVRAVANLLRSETERRAAPLAVELLTRFEAEPRSQESSQQLRKTYQACVGIFPREAAALRRVLEADRVAAGCTPPASPTS